MNIVLRVQRSLGSKIYVHTFEGARLTINIHPTHKGDRILLLRKTLRSLVKFKDVTSAASSQTFHIRQKFILARRVLKQYEYLQSFQ